MRKLFALYQNECIKIFKRVSVLVLSILLVLGIVGAGVLLRVTYSSPSNTSGQSNQTSYQSQLAESKKQLAEVEKQIQEQGETADLTAQRDNLKQQVETFQMRLDYNIVFEGDYRTDAIGRLVQEQATVDSLSAIPEGERTAAQNQQLAQAKTHVAQFTAAAKNSDFGAYLDALRNITKTDASMTEERREAELWLLSQRERLSLFAQGGTNKDGVPLRSSLYYELSQITYSLALYPYQPPQIGSPAPLPP